MLHLLAQPTAESPLPYAEAVSRLASVRHALRLVEPFAGGPASDPSDDVLAAAWDSAGESKQQLFDRRSERMIGAAAAGIEALLDERQLGHQPHSAASETLVDQIRRELREVAGIVLG
jgi:hypothetical protein